MATLKKKIIISGKQGLHARPAAMFVQIANRFDSRVSVRKGDEEINGKSIMGLLMLGADHGSEVVLTVEGVDAQAALLELEAFLAKED